MKYCEIFGSARLDFVKIFFNRFSAGFQLIFQTKFFDFFHKTRTGILAKFSGNRIINWFSAELNSKNKKGIYYKEKL